MSSSTSASKGKQPESQSSQTEPATGPSVQRPLGSIASTDELAPTPRAIGSLARKQDPTTRAGTQRMRFVPTLPMRRKKPDEVKSEEAPAQTAETSSRGRGRGRGSGRGGGPPREEMVASGPFALGPAAGGMRKIIPKGASNHAPRPSDGMSRVGSGLTKSMAPSLRGKPSEEALSKQEEDDMEVYSDDDGVQIVDLEDVRKLDWLAPDSLRKERRPSKRPKTGVKIAEDEKDSVDGVSVDGTATQTKNTAQALDLSDSEEEEEMEDLIDQFSQPDNFEGLSESDQLYCFQFPDPFPTFLPFTPPEPIDVDADEAPKSAEKKVTFADLPANSSTNIPAAVPPPVNPALDGEIGQLEIYTSGAVKMRLGNGLLMDITASTQPSFLQHAVIIDPEGKKMHVVGEVRRRFTASPDLETLLDDLWKEGQRVREEGKTKMDLT